jgi:hypothetical protein
VTYGVLADTMKQVAAGTAEGIGVQCRPFRNMCIAGCSASFHAAISTSCGSARGPRLHAKSEPLIGSTSQTGFDKMLFV